MKLTFILSRRTAIGLVAALPLLLAACGQKGPLVLPAKAVPAVSTPASVPVTTATVTTTTIAAPSTISK